MSTKVRTHDRAFYTGKIKAAWHKQLAGIFEVGDTLIEAKSGKHKLAHGEFEAMIRGADLPFREQTAQRLMTIARDKRLRKASHGTLLPPHWRTLYELTRLTDAAFNGAIASKAIHSDMQRRDAEALLPPPKATLTRVHVQSQSASDSEPVNGSRVYAVISPASSTPSVPVRDATPAAPEPEASDAQSYDKLALPAPRQVNYLLESFGRLALRCGQHSDDDLNQWFENIEDDPAGEDHGSLRLRTAGREFLRKLLGHEEKRPEKPGLKLVSST
jgi:hypothetical protein